VTDRTSEEANGETPVAARGTRALPLDSLLAGAHPAGMKQRILFSLLAALLALPAMAFAKETKPANSKPKARVSIELHDGSRIIGQLASETLVLGEAVGGGHSGRRSLVHRGRRVRGASEHSPCQPSCAVPDTCSGGPVSPIRPTLARAT
jgi:hypothetical protein